MNFKSLVLFFCLLPLVACGHKKPPRASYQVSAAAIAELGQYKGYWIEIQVPQRQLVLVRDQQTVKSFPVAVGMPSYPSPMGGRQIQNVIWNPWWTPPPTSDWVEDPTPVAPRSSENPLGEIKLPLGDSYLIHGTRAVHSIGKWASHGCIRMIFEDLFRVVDTLMTAYSKQSAVKSMQDADANPKKEFSVGLKRTVPVVFTYQIARVQGDYLQVFPDIYKRVSDPVDEIREVLRPHVKKLPSAKKIQTLLDKHSYAKGQYFQVGLEEL